MLTETLKGNTSLFCMSVFCLLFVLFPNVRLKTHRFRPLTEAIFLKYFSEWSSGNYSKKGKGTKQYTRGIQNFIRNNKLCYRYSWVVVEPGILTPSKKIRLAETLFVISRYNIENSDKCRKSRKSFVLAEANLLQMPKHFSLYPGLV